MTSDSIQWHPLYKVSPRDPLAFRIGFIVDPVARGVIDFCHSQFSAPKTTVLVDLRIEMHLVLLRATSGTSP